MNEVRSARALTHLPGSWPAAELRAAGEGAAGPARPSTGAGPEAGCGRGGGVQREGRRAFLGCSGVHRQDRGGGRRSGREGGP